MRWNSKWEYFSSKITEIAHWEPTWNAAYSHLSIAIHSISMVGYVEGPSHIQNGARPTSLRAKKRIFARMTVGVCSITITAGSAANFTDRPAFAGHRNLFLIQRFSNGHISDLRNMTCTNFRYMSYLCKERTSEDARQDVGRSPPERRLGFGRASTDLLNTDRNSEGARPYIDRASHDSR